MRRDWHWKRYIDADHADLDVVGKVTCGFAVAREDAGAIAVFVVIDQRTSRIKICYPYHAQHGAKNFILIDTHLFRNMVKQAAADEETLFMTGDRMIATVNQQRRALFDTQIDIIRYFIKMRSGDQGAHFCLRLSTGQYLQ